MPATPEVRAHAQRDEYMLFDPKRGQRWKDATGADCWALATARRLQASAGDEYRLLHTLTWVTPEHHAKWAEATDYGARTAPGVFPP